MVNDTQLYSSPATSIQFYVALTEAVKYRTNSDCRKVVKQVREL